MTHQPPYPRLFIQPCSDTVVSALEIHLTEAFVERLARLFNLLQSEQLESVKVDINARWHAVDDLVQVHSRTTMEVADYGVSFTSFVVGAPDQAVHAIALYGGTDFATEFVRPGTELTDFLVTISEADWPEGDLSAEEVDHWFESHRQAFSETVQTCLRRAGFFPLRDISSHGEVV